MGQRTAWKIAEVALAAAVVLLAILLVIGHASAAHLLAAVIPPAVASAAFSYARAKSRAAAALAEAIALRWWGQIKIDPRLTPYKSGTRQSAATGETIHVFEFKKTPRPSAESAWPAIPGELSMQQQIVMFLVNALLKELHKLMPDLPADADAQISMMVSGGVGLLWDVAKLEGTKELQNLSSGELAKLFPQLAIAPAAA